MRCPRKPGRSPALNAMRYFRVGRRGRNKGVGGYVAREQPPRGRVGLRLLFLRFLQDIVKRSAMDVAGGKINRNIVDAHLVFRRLHNLRKVGGGRSRGREFGYGGCGAFFAISLSLEGRLASRKT